MWLAVIFAFVYLGCLVGSFQFHLQPSIKRKSSLFSTKINTNSNPITNRKNAEILTTTTSKKENSNNRYSIKRKPEVLSPAGGWPQLRAAVTNGCDAVYFGLEEGFNARARASNFKLEELKEVMSFLHDRSVKGYLALNILVFDNELSQLKSIIQQVSDAGVDALIMQDVGAVKYIRNLAPNLPIHGSTQMSITDGHGSLFAGSLGIERVVVGRELSIAEIHSVVRNCGDVEVEAFVHGALCVSYSGQCFSSEAWGGRSANRGQCAQACRMPYGLIVNGTLTGLHKDVEYLLSPQDLMAVDYVPELIAAGVSSFKIEGRLKGPEYVAMTTRAYRQAIDEVWSQLSSAHPEEEEILQVSFNGPSDSTRRDLAQVFSRGQDEDYNGLSAGFLAGVRHQDLVRGNAPRHRGLLAGKVIGITSKGVMVNLLGPVKRGDGVVFDHGKPEEDEEGGSVYEVIVKGKSTERGEELSSGQALLTFGHNALDMSRIHLNDLVWRNKDPALDQRLKEMVEKSSDCTQIVPVEVSVAGRLGQPLTVSIQVKSKDDINDMSVVYASTTSNLELSTNKPLTADAVNKAIGQLGGTPFFVSGDLDVSGLESGLFVPASEIKAARRDAIENLIALRRVHNRDEEFNNSPDLLQSLINDSARSAAAVFPVDPVPPSTTVVLSQSTLTRPTSTPKLSVLCRTPAQVTAACNIDWLGEIVLDFLEVHGIRDAVRQVQAAGKTAVVATPRVIKPDEERLVFFYLRLKPDAILVRSAGVLQQLTAMGGAGVFSVQANCTIPALRGDFSLNIANAIAAGIFLENGLERVAPTHDLNADQIVDLAKQLQLNGDNDGNGVQSLECILHQHLAIFHTEHCVFCRFLSTGNNYTNCGHPCERDSVKLRSMEGEDHLVLADQGCRNTVFNAKCQTGAEFIPQFLSSGIQHYRVELVDERPEHVEPLLQRYRRMLQSVHSNPTDLRAQQKQLEDFYMWLDKLPDSNGRAQGHDVGSLKPTVEREWTRMKLTAHQKEELKMSKATKSNTKK